MSVRSLGLSDALQDYLYANALREPPLLARLREETARMPQRNLQISPEQGQFLAWLVETCGVRRALEVGVFTGYSSLAVALALPDDGLIVACDVNEEWTAVARRYHAEAGTAHKLDLRLGPAQETLDRLLESGAAHSFDFAFIDADKEGYLAYYEAALALLRSGGVLAFDNVLWHGDVADPAHRDPATEAIRAVTRRAQSDPRVTMSLVPIGDGVLLARKR